MNSNMINKAEDAVVDVVGKAGKKVADAIHVKDISNNIKQNVQFLDADDTISKNHSNHHHMDIHDATRKIEHPQSSMAPISAAPKRSSNNDTATTFSASSSSTEIVLTIYTTILAIYHAYTHKSQISFVNNTYPLSVIVPFLIVAFLLGFGLEKFLSLVASSDEVEEKGERRGGDGSRRRQMMQSKSRLSIHQRRGGMYQEGGMYNACNDGLQYSNISTDSYDESDNEEEDINKGAFTIQKLFKSGWKRKRITKYVKEYSDEQKRSRSRRKEDNANKKSGSKRAAIKSAVSDIVPNNAPQFFTNLSPVKAKSNLEEWERKVKAPFTNAVMMEHLLGYSDFNRHKRSLREQFVMTKRDEKRERASISIKGEDGRTTIVEEEEEVTLVEEEEEVAVQVALGKAELTNTRAQSLEEYEKKLVHWIDPFCELRGMDLFLTDAAEDQIWKANLLNESGLRDVPTLIFNLMTPFGNICAYFKLPDWVDNVSNVPAEKNEDPPDVVALKRFLRGDNEYKKSRVYVIPYVVDGPLAIRLIKPAPIEVSIHGTRHPCNWENVPKSIDQTTGKVNHAVVECDIDLLADKSVRKVINIIRPHLKSITIDVAVIISKPWSSEVPEPSCCLGLWRIDCVDFEKGAIVPEKTLHEAAAELTNILSAVDLSVEVVG